MTLIEQAKTEISVAWRATNAAETSGIAFGKTCYEWSLKLEKIYPLYKELGIRPTDANWWVEKYKVSVGLKDLHKEKRPNRSSPITFEEIQHMALRILLTGFQTLAAREPYQLRALQSAKDWAHSRLSRTDL